MSDITLVIKCDDARAVPEISALFEVMTVDDKRALAAKLAYEFFAKFMHTATSSGYYAETYGARYLKDLADQLRTHIGDELGRNPELQAHVAAIVERCAENKQTFIQHAVTTALGKLIGDTFEQMSRLDAQTCDLFGKVEILKSAAGGSA